MNNVEVLLRLIDEAFDRKSWHGANLRGSIRGLTALEAAWRAQPQRKNIHEMVLHCAYWKYTVRRRLCGEKRGSFPFKGSNWFLRPTADGPSTSQWNEDVQLLIATHKSLRSAIAAIKPSQLLLPAAGGSTKVIQLITGIASHDVYHAGQIQTIKRLFAESN